MNQEDKDPQTDADWEAVLAGKRLPDPEKKDEQTAEQARQHLIWRQAQREAQQNQPVITPEQAKAYYVHINDLENKRRKQPWWHVLKRVFPAVLLLGAGIGIGFYLTDNNVPPPTPKPTPADSTAQSPEPVTTSEQAPQTSEPITSIAESATKASATSTTSAQTTPVMTAGSPPGLLPELVTIPGGNFNMGCTPGWDDAPGGCRANEFPAHSVDVPSFRLARHEVTVGQFRHFVEATSYQTIAEQKQQGCTIADPEKKVQWIISKAHNWRNPGFPQTDAHPAVCLSWADTQHYLQWLNKTTGDNYRLPTEEEWEYAARGGRVTAYFWGNQADKHYANFAGQGATDVWGQTAPAGQFVANPFGLHDMAGNAWEWTKSCWRENYQNASSTGESSDCISSNKTLRTRRGGSWDNQAQSIRAAYRNFGSEVERSYVYGFRVAHDAE